MSLSEHEAEFNGRRPPEAAEPREPATQDLDAEAQAQAREDEAVAADPMRRFREVDAVQPRPARHRAASQVAKPEDVKEIQALTVTLREKEAALLALKPESGEKPNARVLALKRQIRGLEADLAEAQPTADVRTLPAAATTDKPANGAATGAAFSEPEPKLEDFAKDETRVDPYADCARAVAKWDRKKESWEAQQASAVDEAKKANDHRMDVHATAVKAFVQTHPDYLGKVQAAVASGRDLIPLVTSAILDAGDKGPELLYALVGQPDEIDRITLTMSATPVTASSVVAMRRELTRLANQRAAGTSGAAPLRRIREAPPAPITPVRTGFVETGEDEPGDEASLAAHEAAYSRSRRR
jgi:hypothetical protein